MIARLSFGPAAAATSLAVAAEVGGALLGRSGAVEPVWAAAALAFATVLLFAARTLPEHLVALLFFVAAAVARVAPPAVVFSGFTGPAVWLVLSGAAVGAAMRHTGLARRIGGLLAPTGRVAFPLFLARVALFGTALLFLMPSAMGRILLILPMLEATAEAVGCRPGDARAGGIAVAGVFGTFFPAMAVLPANVPNNVLAGLLETTGIGVPGFATYFVLHFPVLGAVKLGLLIALLALVFRREASVEGAPAATRTPLAGGERRLVALLAATVLFWVTDPWHGISAAWIGMAAALACLWPGSRLMPEQPFRTLGMEPVFYVAGVVGVGAVIDHSGLGTRLATIVSGLPAIVGGGASGTFLVLAAATSLAGLLATIVAVPAVVTPIARTIAETSGLSPLAVAMSEVVGFSTVFLPYQAPPLALAQQMSRAAARHMTGICFALALATIVVVWPLDLLWWRLLGWLP